MSLRTYPIYFLSLILLAASACSKKNDSTIPVLNFDDAEIVSPDTLVDSLDIFHLEMKDGKYPFGIKQLLTSEDNIIVFDHKDIIYVYSSDGKYICDSQKKMGKGEGEYSNVTAVSFNKHNNTIEVATPLKLLSYDLNFNNIGNVDLPTKLPHGDETGRFFGSIYDISHDQHLLIPICLANDFRQIYSYNSSLKKLSGKVDFGDDILDNTTMQSQCFQPLSTDTLIFFPPGISNYIYTFTPSTNELHKYLQMTFGANGITETELRQFNSDEDSLMDYILNTEKAIPLKSMAYKNYILTIIKIGRTLDNWYTIVWNPTTRKAYRLNVSVNDKTSFPIFDYVDNKGIYSIVDSDTFQEITKTFNPTKIKTDSLEIPDGSFVVLKYRLK